LQKLYYVKQNANLHSTVTGYRMTVEGQKHSLVLKGLKPAKHNRSCPPCTKMDRVSLA